MRRFDCHKARGGAASKAAGRQLACALERIAYGGRHGSRGTVTVRRGDIGEDAGDKRSPAQGKFYKPVHDNEAE